MSVSLRLQLSLYPQVLKPSLTARQQGFAGVVFDLIFLMTCPLINSHCLSLSIEAS